MKRMLLIGAAVLMALALFGCGDDAASAAAETPAAADSGSGSGIMVDNAFYYTHVSGHQKETEMVAYVLFEFEQLKTVKYQVAYIACTCRGPDVNYYSVAYVELDKSDGSVAALSYDMDSTDHYTAGMYGDSVLTYEGVPAQELFAVFREEVLVGASQADINAITPMHGEVDGYTGATVTPNNAVRMLQGLFEYHNERYSS